MITTSGKTAFGASNGGAKPTTTLTAMVKEMPFSKAFDADYAVGKATAIFYVEGMKKQLMPDMEKANAFLIANDTVRLNGQMEVIRKLVASTVKIGAGIAVRQIALEMDEKRVQQAKATAIVKAREAKKANKKAREERIEANKARTEGIRQSDISFAQQQSQFKRDDAEMDYLQYGADDAYDQFVREGHYTL